MMMNKVVVGMAVTQGQLVVTLYAYCLLLSNGRWIYITHVYVVYQLFQLVTSMMLCVYTQGPGGQQKKKLVESFFLFLKKRNSKTLTTDRCWGSRFLKVDCHVSVAAGKILHDRSVVVINGTDSKSLSSSFVAYVMLVFPFLFAFRSVSIFDCSDLFPISSRLKGSGW